MSSLRFQIELDSCYPKIMRFWCVWSNFYYELKFSKL